MTKKIHFWLAAMVLLLVAPIGNQAYAQKNEQPPKFKTFNQQAYRSSGGQVKTLLKSELRMTNNDQLIKTNAWTDNIGFQHIKYQQAYKGIRVAKSTYAVHSQNGYVKVINGDFLKIGDLNITPSVNKGTALQKAVAATGVKNYTQLGKEELVVCRDYIGKDGKAHLAYRFVIIAPESHTEVFVDAHTGKTLLKNPLLRSCFIKGHKHHKKHAHQVKKSLAAQGSSITLYDGNQTIFTQAYNNGYRLYDDARGNGIHVKNSNNNQNWDFNGATEFVDNDNNWTAGEWDNAAKDAAGMSAFWAYEKTYDYFKNNHNRNSIDDNGRLLRALVHSGNNWFNAQYSSAYVMMRFGDGNGSPLTTIDITAHELAHGLTDFTADLVYSYESGALNESFSDIFGAAVEAEASPNKSRWLMGEDIGHIRDMANPNAKNHPDTYKGTHWYTGAGDNGGVHYNSGVLNHWFHILSEGKSGTNDNGDSFDVSGITIEKAGKVAYRMLSTYLSANSQYADARVAGIQAVKDLYGDGSNEEIQVTNAFYAVGVGAAYDDGTPPPPATCVTVFPYGESFEAGLGKWTQATSDDLNWTRDSGGTPSSNTGPSAGSDGDFYMFVEASSPNFPSKTATLVSPCFDIAALNNPTFSFDYHMYGTQVNNLKLEVSTDGTTWTQVFTKSGDQGDNWLSESIDLTAYKGSSVSLRFTATTGAGTGNGWQSDIAIDNIKVDGDTTTPPATYCVSKANSVHYEHIGQVVFGTINNTSDGGDGYSDFTAMSTGVALNSTTTITITPAWPNNITYNESYGVWIDLNQDGDFDDAGEQVFAKLSTKDTPVSGTITIPASAKLGATRMRISMKYNTAPSACGEFPYGETEDYTINIGGSSSVSGFTNVAAKSLELNNATVVFPSPATEFTNVKITLNHQTKVSISIVNAQGREVARRTVEGQAGAMNQKFDVKRLPAGIYLMRVTKDGITTTKRFIVK
ncbi:M4 family metallopeptidase [Microscilla marina]|uniref:Thermolysin n=1 Tax=Microscilla marina ATCC 23134 TaxID=313606 RepID=A1ZNB1_MICM2|nr:M4 family metallopeptidase [Microscilla marina]EAY28022.1 thermolysin [Microscilla marina ATCC 23134]